MSRRNEEDIKELLERFFDAGQALRTAEDIRKAEQILHEYPAPLPSEKLLADVKAKIADALLHRKIHIFHRTAYRITAVAAVFIILASVGIAVKLFEKSAISPDGIAAASIIPRAVWDSDDATSGDAGLAVLTAEVEQAEGDLRAVQLGENGSRINGDILDDMEVELMELNSNFWKG